MRGGGGGDWVQPLMPYGRYSFINISPGMQAALPLPFRYWLALCGVGLTCSGFPESKLSWRYQRTLICSSCSQLQPGHNYVLAVMLTTTWTAWIHHHHWTESKNVCYIGNCGGQFNGQLFSFQNPPPPPLAKINKYWKQWSFVEVFLFLKFLGNIHGEVCSCSWHILWSLWVSKHTLVSLGIR